MSVFVIFIIIGLLVLCRLSSFSEGLSLGKGSDGKDGAQGIAGKDGKDGAQGIAGKDGKNGAQGVSNPANSAILRNLR